MLPITKHQKNISEKDQNHSLIKTEVSYSTFHGTEEVKGIFDTS